MKITDPSYFGTLTFGEPEVVELPATSNPAQKFAFTCEKGEWRPPERLAAFLPPGYSIPVDCWKDSDGLRRIVPRCSFEELIDPAAVGGLAVVHGIHGFDRQIDCSYRAMFLVHQHVRGRTYKNSRGMKEHLSREFLYARDLFVRRLGRIVDGECDVLPDAVGLNAEGKGRRLSVSELTELGRRTAREAGCNNRTSAQSIQYGLFAAAKMNPLEVTPDEVPHLVRMALFDLPAGEKAPSRELVEIVTERLLAAIDRHFDDSGEAFDAWFTGPKNSLVKQIAQQKSKPGGKLSRDDVRRALLHLGWQAYSYVGQCVHALLRTIKNSVPVPLNETERRLFETMHESQPVYGDLPLALLAERARYLRQAILAIWNEPENGDHLRVLHRLLAYYAEMASKRREADRQSKQRCRSGPAARETGNAVDRTRDDNSRLNREDSNCPENPLAANCQFAGSFEFLENLHGQRPAADEPFAQVADHIRELRQIACEGNCGGWDFRCENVTNDPVTILMRCACGRVERKIDVSVDEFAEHAERILSWKRPALRSSTADVKEPSSES